jgi:hypothetical protein
MALLGQNMIVSGMQRRCPGAGADLRGIISVLDRQNDRKQKGETKNWGQEFWDVITDFGEGGVETPANRLRKCNSCHVRAREAASAGHCKDPLPIQ